MRDSQTYGSGATSCRPPTEAPGAAGATMDVVCDFLLAVLDEDSGDTKPVDVSDPPASPAGCP